MSPRQQSQSFSVAHSHSVALRLVKKDTKGRKQRLRRTAFGGERDVQHVLRATHALGSAIIREKTKKKKNEEKEREKKEKRRKKDDNPLEIAIESTYLRNRSHWLTVLGS